jgi:hypothetical protein
MTQGEAPSDSIEPAVRASVLCDDSESADTEADPEVYMLSAMNRKLQYYPEFASTIGMDSVRDCDGARRFMRSYAEYRMSHVDFDANQPLDPNPPQSPSPPVEPSGKLEFPKILNGLPAVNNPVIRLEYTNFFGGNPFICTGTFIAKNWILTAAHCIRQSAVDSCRRAGKPLRTDTCNPEWHLYSKWTIHHTDFDLTDVWALAYVHDNWLGRVPEKNPLFEDSQVTCGSQGAPPPPNCIDLNVSAEHDLALLYIDDDVRLPPNVELDGAKRISLVQPNLTWPLTFYGWGNPTNTLRQSTAVQGITGIIYSVQAHTITGQTTQDLSSAICGGDSGGPLVRTVRVATSSGFQTVEAVVGVASSGLGPNSCVSPVPFLTPLRWARVDTPSNFEFIGGKALRAWNGPRFSCLKLPSEGSPPDQEEVAECWGSPCEEQAECDDMLGEYCSNPGRDFSDLGATCPTCDTPAGGGGCGCIVGQCLPGPDE